MQIKTTITRDNATEVLENFGRELAHDDKSRVTAWLDDYALNVKEHPYFPEMKERVNALTDELLAGGRIPEGFRAIEVGAGGGNLTEALVRLPFGALIISDLDEEGHFVEKLRSDFGDIPGVLVQRRDLLECQPETDFFDIAYSCAVDHHIEYNRKRDYFRNVRSIIRPGGFYASADVLVTGYANEFERARSVALFHAIVIDEALAQGKRGAARISYQAWQNERKRFDEYKVSLTDYIEDISSAGFELFQMHKIGPHDEFEHGIYLSVFRSPA